jgi:pilus assembly protein TadC
MNATANAKVDELMNKAVLLAHCNQKLQELIDFEEPEEKAWKRLIRDINELDEFLEPEKIWGDSGLRLFFAKELREEITSLIRRIRYDLMGLITLKLDRSSVPTGSDNG